MSLKNKATLSTLSNRDLEQLEDYSQGLNLPTDMETEMLEETLDIKPIMQEEYIEGELDEDEEMEEDDDSQQEETVVTEEVVEETEIGEHEIEVESEMDRVPSPDEILPDIKISAAAKTHVPPLRPLNIAPKPTAPKQVPIAVKTVGGNVAGQQIVFIQSTGTFRTATSGQQIKIVSPQGQNITTIPNFQNLTVGGKQVTLRPAAKTSSTIGGSSTVVKTVSGGSAGSAQQKQNVLTKVVFSGGNQQNLMLSPTNEGQQQTSQQIKLATSGPTKTITMAQAQQMGLIAGGKLQQILPQGTTKLTAGTKTIKVVQQQPKSPTKILPHPTAKTGQRFIIKQGGVMKTANALPPGTILSAGNQLIKVTGGQSLSGNTTQLHQINVPGKGVQYIRFLSTSSSSTAGTAGGNTSSNVTIKTFPQVSHSGSKVVPVAGITVNRASVQNSIKTTSGTVVSGSGQSIIKVVSATSAGGRPVVPKPASTTQRVLIPSNNKSVSGTTGMQTQSVTTIPASALSQLQGATLIPSNNNVGQIVMLPSNYVQQLHAQSNAGHANSKVAIPSVTAKMQGGMGKPKLSMKQHVEFVSTNLSSLPPIRSVESKHIPVSPESAALTRNLEQNGIRPRKPCNCTKSQCLKLYCDCFANGEFCHMCNCMNCNNNLENEDSRHKAIKSCLERNPNAFRPKIGKGKDSSSGDTTIRKHTKGCNCKRSGCLKNYCECYEAKIACSSNCKCMGCRNIEDSMDKKALRPQAQSGDLSGTDSGFQAMQGRVGGGLKPDITSLRPKSISNQKQAGNYISTNVVEATNSCLLAFTADNPDNDMQNEEVAMRLIIQEYGRCLVEIIDASQQT